MSQSALMSQACIAPRYAYKDFVSITLTTMPIVGVATMLWYMASDLDVARSYTWQ